MSAVAVLWFTPTGVLNISVADPISIKSAGFMKNHLGNIKVSSGRKKSQ